MKKTSLQKFLALTLSLFLAFLWSFPLSHPAAWAVDQTLDPTGAPVATVPASEAPEVVPSQELPTFQDPDNPLLRPEDNAIVTITSHSYNDPLYSNSNNYWHGQANAKEAHHLSEGTDVPVAVLDTGFDFNHEDRPLLWSNTAEANGIPGVDDDGNGKIDDVNGWDFYNGDNDPSDDNGHGTAVSGIIGAAANNGLGIVGIAPSSRIIPIKVLNAQGSGFVVDVINAIRYAADLGAKVINMSLGVFKSFLSKSLQQAFKDAINYARSKGVVTVAAAGNDGGNVANTYPAEIADFAVGAIDRNKKRPWWSNFGNALDLVAGGVSDLLLRATGTNFGSSCVSNPKYSCASGTSFSSPIVAGVVALLRAYSPSLTVSQIYQRLTSTATDLGARGFDKYFGYGLVNAYKALTASSSSSTVRSSEEGSPLGGRNPFFGGWNPFAKDIPDVPQVGLPTPVALRSLTHYHWDPTRSSFSSFSNPKRKTRRV